MSASIALDFGGTSIKAALVSDDRLLVTDEIKVADSSTLGPLLPEIKSRIEAMANSVKTHSFDGIGLAFPSLVDNVNKRIVSDYVKYRDINDLDLVKWASDTWDIPLVMDNDARAALIGEWQYGAGKGVDDIVQVTIGTGVGSAVLSGGRILRGKHYMAGNLGGHMTVKYDGDTCNCGNIGCLETVASTWALPGIARSHQGFENSLLSKEEKIDFESLFRLSEKNDDLALHLQDQCIRAWSFGLINLVHAFDPEVLIISGGVMKSGKYLLPVFQEMIDRHTWLPSGTVEVREAVNQNYAAALGLGYIINTRN